MSSMRTRPLPRTDLGTICLHWAVALATLLAIATGISIAAAGTDASWADRLIAFVLPADRVWLLHIASGMGLFAVLVGYATYSALAGTVRKNQIDRARLQGLFIAGRARWTAVSLLLQWATLFVLGSMTVSGMALHLQPDLAIGRRHGSALWVLVALIIAHVLSHAALGGSSQLTRLFRPSSQEGGLADLLFDYRPHGLAITLLQSFRVPLLVAAALLSAIAAYIAAVPRSIPHLVVHKVQRGPDLRTELSDPLWLSTRPLQIRTHGGANFAKGESVVEIRAIHDESHAFFAFTWADPIPDSGPAAEAARPEDQFALMFSSAAGRFGPGAFHPGPKPLPDKPASSSGHGLHYTTDGSTVDVLQWHAGPGLGWCELKGFGAPLEPSDAQQDGAEHYSGGVRLVQTYPRTPPGPENVSPAWRSRWMELVSQMRGLNRWAVSLPTPITAQTWVSCAGTWSAGRWTLVISRPLGPLHPNGLALQAVKSVFIAAFNQTHSEHSRHVLPISIEVQQ
jgi:hypothetical protein